MIKALIFVTGLALMSPAVPAAEKVPPLNRDRSGVALKGYDPVAYFQGQAKAGDSKLTESYEGVTFRFVNEQNRKEFASNPNRYVPQYGGYCAYGVSRGYAVDVDPEAFKVLDGKLYLNYSKGVQKTWEKDIPGYIQKADANWPSIHR